MRIGWRQYIKSKFRRRSSYDSVGIALSADTVAFCALKKSAQGKTVAHYHETTTAGWPQALEKWVNQHKIGFAPCAVSFASQLYNVVQIDKPAVPESELHQALTWSIKDLTGGDEREMVFDYFDPPAQSSGNQKVNMAIMPADDIQEIIKATTEAGLALDTITIEDLAVCELFRDVKEPVITILQRAGLEIELSIIKDANLYFARSLKGFENLGSFSVAELQMGVLDSLTVQIQRSMDYFESQLRQAPVRKVLYHIESSNSAAIGQQIADAMQVDVVPFELGIDVDENIESDIVLHSVGAALMINPAAESKEGDAA